MRAFPCLLALTACAPQVGLTEWEPLDEEALLDTLDNPTATVADFEALVEEVYGAIEAGNVVDLIDTVTSDDPADAPPRTTEGTVTSTSLWVRVACPGPELQLDPEFDYGWLQLESPVLLDEDDALSLTGDLLVTVESCELATTVWDGAAVAHWDPATETLLAESSLGVHLVDDPDQSVIFTGIETRPDRRRRAILLDQGSATLELRSGDGLTWALILADGEFVCTVGSGTATCSTDGAAD